jgi:hypothetical protein
MALDSGPNADWNLGAVVAGIRGIQLAVSKLANRL